jgi:hypothetical protein
MDIKAIEKRIKSDEELYAKYQEAKATAEKKIAQIKAAIAAKNTQRTSQNEVQ